MRTISKTVLVRRAGNDRVSCATFSIFNFQFSIGKALMLVFLLMTINVQATVRYVRLGGIVPVSDVDAINATSWATACADLQAVINISAAGDEIWVAAGVYRPTHSAAGWTVVSPTPANSNAADRDNAFVLKEGVKIYGGFPDTGSAAMNDRQPDVYISTLSGNIGGAGNTDNCYHVVLGAGTLSTATLLDGFTVSEGYSSSSNSGTITVNGVTGVSRYSGAGITLWSSASPTFNNIVISDNTAYNGGGVYTSNCSPVFTNAIISGNTGYNGGGFYIYTGTLRLSGSVVSGNTANNSGGGFYNYSGSPVLTNLTVVANKANSGGGIYGNTSVSLRNSIVWKNTRTNGTTVDNIYGTLTHSYTLVEGATTENGLISADDPAFVDFAGGDYRLTSCSPAINIGLDTMYRAGGTLAAIVTDIDGYPRRKGVGIDLGAYEYQDAPVITPDANNRVYVRKDCFGNTAKVGNSWNNAYPDLADVILAAASPDYNIEEIWVAEAEYKPRHIRVSNGSFHLRDRVFTLVDGVKIYGGFAATGNPTTISDRNPKTYITILSGEIGESANTDNCHHIVLGAGTLTPATLLDGFTLTRAYATSSNSNTITVNGISGIYQRYGGGISLWSSASPTLKNLVIIENTSYYGGAIYNNSCSPIVTDVRIASNTTSYGGGMYNDSNSSPELTNVQIAGNRGSSYGGGIYNNAGSSPELINVQITGNTVGSYGGGIYNNSNDCSPQLINVTLVGNYASNYGGIYFSTATLQVRNSIIYGNAASSNPDVNNTSAAIYDHSLVKGMNAGVADADPKFVASDYATSSTVKPWGNYSLLSSSPAVDKGDESLNSTVTDVNGNARRQGCAIDLGAFETNISAELSKITSAAGRIYVKPSSEGNGSGDSWANAASLADALAAAKLFPCKGFNEIWAAEGTYLPTRAANELLNQDPTNRDNAFVLVEGLKIYGGFNGNPSGALPPFGTPTRNGESILSGDIGDAGTADNCYHIVVGAGKLSADARLDGFTITGAYSVAADNGAIEINATSGITRNCGGGITLWNGAAPALSNLRIVEHSAHSGAAIYNNNSAPTLTNMLIAKNTAADKGGAFFNYSGTPTLTNLTVVDNKANEGGGLHRAGGTVNLRNSIVWGNTKTTGTTADNISGASISHSYNMLEGGVNENGLIAVGDPMFVDPDGGDYHLQACSPAINTGLDTAFFAGKSLEYILTDIDGTERVKGTGIDLGAYEFRDAPAIVPTSGRVYVKENNACIVAANDGSSWAKAYPYLADVVMAAAKPASGISEIWVAKGTYRPRHVRVSSGDFQQRDRNFTLVEGVKIYGGFEGFETATNERTGLMQTPYKSILSGDIDGNGIADNGNAFHVALGAGTVSTLAELDGFTITGAFSESSDNGNITVNGANIIRYYGGGITLYTSASPALNNLAIVENTAYYYGGGVYNNNSSPVLTGIQISGNTAYYGGGIYNDNSSSPILTNVLISGNTANYEGGGMSNRNSNNCFPILTNVTVAGNYSGSYGGIYFSSNSPANTVRNSIIYGNGSGANVNFISAMYVRSLVQGSNAGIADGDPKFVAPDYATSVSVPKTGGDYRLKPSSPVVEKGDNSVYSTGQTPDLSGVTADLDGKSRIMGCNIDLGAYEAGAVAPNANGIVFVKVDGTGDGSSWANACGGLAVPLAAVRTMAACTNIKEIWVAEGTYKPEYPANFNEATPSTEPRDMAFVLVEGVKIYGGFPDSGNPGMNDRDPEQFISTLSGDIGGTVNTDNVFHVVLGVGNLVSAEQDTARLDGFTISGGYSTSSNNTYITVNGSAGITRYYGGGISLWNNASPILTNLVVSDNSAYYGGGIYTGTGMPILTKMKILNNTAYDGGGMYNSSDTWSDAAPVLTNVQISGNTANSRNGGGFYNYSGNPRLNRTLISNNAAYNSGGGFYNNSGSPILTNLTIENNAANLDGGIYEGGGGLFFYGGTPSLINVLIRDNTAKNAGGGIYIVSHIRPVLTNLTIVGNKANNGGGIYSDNTGTINNSIIWGNTKANGEKDNASGITCSYTLLEEGSGKDGVISIEDPMFVAPDGGDYRLQACSPAINTGLDTMYRNAGTLASVVTDLDENARIRGVSIDLGAYEFQAAADITPDNGRVYVRKDCFGDPTKNGFSWSLAYPCLADALMIAANPDYGIKEIWVAEGTYLPRHIRVTTGAFQPIDRTFTMVEGVKVYGGFKGDETEITERKTVLVNSFLQMQNETILSGDLDGNATPDNGNANHIVLAAGNTIAPSGDTARLDGFTVTGGSSYSNTTITVNGTSGIVRYNGGGVAVWGGASPTLSNLIITDNRGYNGGGVYSNNSSPVLNNVRISNNSGSYGQFYHDNGASVLTAVMISNNQGVGFYNNNGAPILTSTIICGNNSGGFYNKNGTPVLTNLTIVNNQSYGGVYREGGNVHIRNSIIWGNSTPTTGTISYAYTLLEGATSEYGVISAENPMFVDADQGDYHLMACSPAINTGMDTMYLAGGKLESVVADFDQATRIKGVGIDLGAYEFQDVPNITLDNGRLYVKKDCFGDATRNGNSWATAYPCFADALLAAANPNYGIKEIWVAEGTYKPRHIRVSSGDFQHANRTFTTVAGVKICGGFKGVETDIAQRETVLMSGSPQMRNRAILSGDINGDDVANSGDAFHTVLVAGSMISGQDTAALDGLTITGACSSSFDNNNRIFVNGEDMIFNHSGGGMYIRSDAPPVLTNLVIDRNTAYGGGGVYSYSSSPVLTNVIISNNTVTDGNGGGFYNSNGNTVLTNVIISGNTAGGDDGARGLGGGFHDTGGSVLTNVIIVRNTANNGGGGIYNRGKSVFTNLTVVSNKAGGGGNGGGIYLVGSTTLSNSIIWGNARRDGSTTRENITWDNNESCFYSLVGSDANLNNVISAEDPMFVDADADDYHLLPCSPAINVGIDTMYCAGGSLAFISGDFDDAPRVRGSGVDLGAYEFQAAPDITPNNGRVYVKKDCFGDASKNGDSWATAYPCLADVLLAAADPTYGIKEIWVAEGTYKPRHIRVSAGTFLCRDRAFVPVEGVKVYGGFIGSESTIADRDTIVVNGVPRLRYKSILSGDINGDDAGGDSYRTENSYHTVLIAGNMISGQDTARLDGFTVKGGYSSYQLDNSSITINRVSGINRSYGGGISIWSNAKPVLTNLIVTDNIAYYGAGIYNNSSPALSNVQILSNMASKYDIGGYGGGFYNAAGGAPIFINGIISGNRAYSSGGGFVNSGGTPVLINVLISGNAGGDNNSCGGYANSGKTSTLINVTIVNNTGYGISHHNGNDPTCHTIVRNSIIWGNGITTGNSGLPSFSYVLVQGMSPIGDHVLDGNTYTPKFVNPMPVSSAPTVNGDYRLQTISPVIDQGNNSYIDTIPLDLALTPRIQGCRVDLGAFEAPNVQPDLNGIVYVKVDGTGDGSSWDKAYGGLADPLVLAKTAQCGTIKEIWVASGTYHPQYPADFNNANPSTKPIDRAFVLVEGVKVYGGFNAANPETSVAARDTMITVQGMARMRYETILSGDLNGDDDGSVTNKSDNACHVIVGAGSLVTATGDTARLDGFTVTGGYSTSSTNSSLTVNSVTSILEKNGGGISLYWTEASSPALTNLLIVDNTAELGGGLYCYRSNIVLTKVQISDNTASYRGGGVYNGYSRSIMTGVIISGNTAGNRGGGIYTEYDPPALTNVLISGNTSVAEGGGIYTINGSPQPINTTIVGNTASSGGGFYVETATNVRMYLYNSIVWGNTKTNGTTKDNFAGDLRGEYSLVEGYTFPDGTGNLVGDAINDPLFMSPQSASAAPTSGGNYRLRPNSAVIDKGSDTYVAAVPYDLTGIQRIQGCSVDMGAYEMPAIASGVRSDINNIVYVRVDGTGDGSSWANAYPNLADPLAAAKLSKCVVIKEIRVAAGTYTPLHPADYSNATPSSDPRDRAFVLVAGVKVYGGFDAINPESDIHLRDTVVTDQGVVQMFNKSILSGDINNNDDSDLSRSDNAYHVVIVAGNMLAGTDVALLDGFTLTGGSGSTTSTTLTVNNETIARNSGGGITIANATPILLRDSIAGNTATAEGGGVYVVGVSDASSAAVFVNAYISGNTSTTGGGVSVSSGAPRFIRTIVSGNTANVNGGGVYVGGGKPVFTNALVSGNTANSGGGVESAGGSAVFTNLTVAGNYGVVSTGGGLNVHSSGAPAFRNTVVWANSSSGVVLAGSYHHTLVEGVDLGGVGTGNYDGSTSPLFVNVVAATSLADRQTGGDYRLQTGSPAINGGDNSVYALGETPDLSMILIDLEGNPRFKDIAIDLGAYEMQGIPITATDDTVMTRVRIPVTILALANDDLGTCPAVVVAMLAVPVHGTANVNSIDNTLEYTPDLIPEHFGIDSLDYEIQCDGNRSQARVYILTLKPLLEEYYACPGTSLVVGFAKSDNVSYDWYESTGTNKFASSADPITVNKDVAGTQVYLARPSWRAMSFPFDTVKVYPAPDRTPSVADIRLTLCPSPVRPVYLTTYLDSLSYASAVHWTTSAGSPSITDPSTGALDLSHFPERGTFTYTYVRDSECSTTTASGKAYVHVAHGKLPPRRDTIMICRDHASSININAIFGFDLGSSPTYSNDLSSYISTTALNAVIFDGDKAYDNSSAPVVTCRGFVGKAFEFEYDYTASDCTGDITGKIVIVIYEI
jgi:hypothetical protein